MAIADTISSMYENVSEVYDTITNVDINNGKNLFNANEVQIGMAWNNTNNSARAVIIIPVEQNIAYTISMSGNNSMEGIYVSYSAKTLAENATNGVGLSLITSFPRTYTSSTEYIILQFNKSSISLSDIEKLKLQVEKGTATEYQPYTDNPTYKNIENIPKVIRKSYLNIMNNGIDTIYDNWEKVNGTGTSLTLNNTEEAPMTIEYKGNTSQETTTGQNLLPNNQTTQTINGVTFTMNSDKSVTITGTATTNTDYYFVGTSSEYEDFGLTTGTYNLNGCTGGSEQTYMLFTVMNRNGNIYYYNNTYAGGRSMIVETGDKFRIFIRVISGKNVNTTIYPQINVGSTALPYEPYTNGASPNPTYPQDIHIVSGDNYINVCGKNLFNIEGQYETGTGITLTKNDDGSYTLNGTANGNNFFRGLCYLNEQHTISYTSSVANSNVIIRTRTGTPTAQTGIQDQLFVSSTSGNLTSSKQFDFVEISIPSGTTLNNFKIYIQLEKGNQVTDFQPYQNASYEINLGVENYLPNNATTQTINGITYTINEDKSIKINGTASGRADIYLYGSNTDTGSYTYIPKGTYTIDTSNLLDGTMFLQFREKTAGVVYQTKQNNGLLTLLSQQDCYFYGIMLAVESGKTINNLTFYPQIEKGTKKNSYTPYGTTPIELCKIGDYQDSILKDNGKWYLNKQIGKVVLNGTQNITLASGTPRRFNATYTTLGINNVKSGSTALETQNNYRMCDYFYYASGVNTWGVYYLHNNWLVLLDSGSAIASASDLATWLSNNPTTIYYVLATPTYTEITGELLNQLEAIKNSYENQTNINQENNDLPFELEVGALEKY